MSSKIAIDGMKKRVIENWNSGYTFGPDFCDFFDIHANGSDTARRMWLEIFVAYNYLRPVLGSKIRELDIRDYIMEARCNQYGTWMFYTYSLDPLQIRMGIPLATFSDCVRENGKWQQNLENHIIPPDTKWGWEFVLYGQHAWNTMRADARRWPIKDHDSVPDVRQAVERMQAAAEKARDALSEWGERFQAEKPSAPMKYRTKPARKVKR